VRALFPDNTVLCNFAAVGRLDLLRDFLRGRGRWVEAVAEEARASARHLPILAGVHREGWLGEAIAIDDPDDIAGVERLRRHVFGGSAHEPRKHLGESQTCHVIVNWASFAGSVWISDDQASIRYAQARGITAWETIHIVSAIVADGDMSAQDAYDLMLDMADHDRRLTLPEHPRDLAL